MTRRGLRAGSDRLLVSQISFLWHSAELVLSRRRIARAAGMKAFS